MRALTLFSLAIGTALASPAGAGVGALVGMASPGGSWDEVPLGDRVSIAPSRDGCSLRQARWTKATPT